MRKLLFIIATIMAFTTCCKDEKPCMDPTNPDCQNYDPCYGKERPSAKFIMEESEIVSANKGIWFADSVFRGSMLRFRSELTDSKIKHTWYVGSEVFTTSTTPNRNYNNVARPSFVTVSHVIEYEPDLNCFPDDDGKDSVVQTFRLVASLNEFQTYGTYRGVLNSQTDSFEIKIISVDIDGQPANLDRVWGQYFINIHKRGDTLSNGFGGSNNLSGFLFNRKGFLERSLEGTIHVDDQGTFEMKYRDDDNSITGDGLWHTFKGRKVN